jgi:hypothetical protein
LEYRRFEPHGKVEYLHLRGGEGKGGWKSFHNEELHKLYFLANIIRVTRSRRRRLRNLGW